jgi:hypothetical protein
MAPAVEPDHQTADQPSRNKGRNAKMNEEPRGDPARPGPARARAGRVTAALAAVVLLASVALLAAACGGSTAPTAHLTTYQKELAYAECMRAHGMPSFPDPQSDGTFAGSFDFGSAAYKSANRACAHLQAGMPGTTEQFQQQVAQSLKYAACMRAHGITNFQTTVSAEGQVRSGIQGPGDEMNTPQFQSASQACRKFQTAGGS